MSLKLGFSPCRRLQAVEATAAVFLQAAKNGMKSVARLDKELDSFLLCYPPGPDPVAPRGGWGKGVGGGCRWHRTDSKPQPLPGD